MFKKIRTLFQQITNIAKKIDDMQVAVGRIESRQLLTKNFSDINDFEFRVTSQWGEDGIIQFLINKIPITNKVFVEFGVESFQEANTRFLIANNNWTGLIIDGCENNINKIKNDPIYWRHNLKAISAFIDKDNINTLLKNSGLVGEIGILSIDIDGNDYWVWESINIISPQIVICEYNSIFGSRLKISTLYDSGFVRSNIHYSNLYYGASISALEFLAKKKGYVLVGSNSAGNNLFFVKENYSNLFSLKSAKDLYVKSQFRESRNEDGSLLFLTASESINLIKNLTVQDVETGKVSRICDLELN